MTVKVYKCPFCGFMSKYYGVDGKECTWGLNWHMFKEHETRLTIEVKS